MSDGSIIVTTEGPVAKYTPPTPTEHPQYCERYAEKNEPGKPKWTQNYCNPKYGSFEESMKNIDGVICACGGVKVANVPAGVMQPGIQESSMAFGQVWKMWKIRGF